MNHRFYVLAATIVLLAGCKHSDNPCGGFTPCDSGTGNTGNTGDSGSSGLITLDRNNSMDALREAWFAATASADVPDFVVATGIGDTSGGVAMVGRVLSKMPSRDPIHVVPFGPTTYNCPISGTFIVTGDVTDANTVTAGDFYSYESSACDSGTGYTVEGTHSIDIVSIDGDVGANQYEQVQELTFTNFQGATPTLVTTLVGDHTAAIDNRPANSITTSFSGNSLSIEEDQVTLTVQEFSGFLSVRTVAPFTYSFDATGTADSTLIQGSFDFFVEETMQIPQGESPTDGIFDIFGANRGTARLSVVDQTLVRVQLDENGSDNFEVSTDMTWDEFLDGSVVLSLPDPMVD